MLTSPPSTATQPLPRQVPASLSLTDGQNRNICQVVRAASRCHSQTGGYSQRLCGLAMKRIMITLVLKGRLFFITCSCKPSRMLTPRLGMLRCFFAGAQWSIACFVAVIREPNPRSWISDYGCLIALPACTFTLFLCFLHSPAWPTESMAVVTVDDSMLIEHRHARIWC